MSQISSLVAKSTNLVLGKITNCTSLPGKLAYKINSNSLSDICIENTPVIFIMGTNGKSTITNYLYNILKVLTNKNIISNISGANMYQGILTCLLLNQKKGKIENSIILLEVDELTMPNLVRDGLIPDYVLLNNLFDDQVDRYSSKENLVIKLKDTFNSITSNLTLLINRDDPSLINLYGLKEKENIHLLTFSVQPKDTTYSNRIIKNDLVFDYINYGNIGRFNKKIISNTDVMNTDFLTTYNGEPNNIESSFLFELISDNLNNIDVSMVDMYFYLIGSKKNIFNLYNISGALSLLFTLINNGDLGTEVSFNFLRINSILNNVNIDGRMEKFNLKNGNTAILNLVKNEVGANLTISEFNKFLQSNKSDIIINFGNSYADGKDLSWINKIDFSVLSDNSNNLKNIYILKDENAEVLSAILDNKTLSDFNLIVIDKMKDVKIRNNILILSNFSKLKLSRKFLKKNSYEI